MKDDRLISLNAAIEEIEAIVDTMSVCISMDECKGMRRMKQSVLEKIKALPSAQPEPEEFEWCHTCREYDQEKHCCHRWTKVIRKTVDEMKAAQPGWIPTSERLPEGIGQAIVQTNGGAIHEVFYKGKNDYGHDVWMRLDGGIYWDDEVVAWMPLPTPWEGGQDG